MFSKQRVAVLMGVLGVGLLVFAAIIASWASPESENGQSLMMWLMGSEMDMDNEFSRILVLCVSLGVAMMAACVLVAACMIYFRAHLGVEDQLEWDD